MCAPSEQKAAIVRLVECGSAISQNALDSIPAFKSRFARDPTKDDRSLPCFVVVILAYSLSL